MNISKIKIPLLRLPELVGLPRSPEAFIRLLSHHRGCFVRGVLLIFIIAGLTLLNDASVVTAETQMHSSNGFAAEAAWTTCPPVAQFDGQLCNYTATYAASGSNFRPFVIIQMANVRMFRNGAVETAAIGTGYMQPSTVGVDPDLDRASASASVVLYGNCSNPNVISTCVQLGVAALTAQWAASAAPAEWSEAKNFTSPERINYDVKTGASSRGASVKAAAAFNGQDWPLGAPIAGSPRIVRFTINETLTCPQTCPPATQALENINSTSTPGATAPGHQSRAETQQLEAVLTGNDGAGASEATSDAIVAAAPFDFSPLGQVRSIFNATGFYGPATRGLGNFVQDILSSYIQSGRSFGFYPQAYNNAAFFQAANFNSSGVFFRFNNPFPG